MIQTQLLRLDPPYQIISAGGQVGIQLATLIVTEEKILDSGEYSIDTHSHPVVSYGLKQGLERVLNEEKSDPLFFPSSFVRLQPEGAVWNKVEISDIKVLGLAGVENELMTQDWFVTIVPSDPKFWPWDFVWNKKTISQLYEMSVGLKRVCFKCEENTPYLKYDHDGRVLIALQLYISDENVPLVQVVIRNGSEYSPKVGNIQFCVRLYDNDNDKQSIDECIKTITGAVRSLKSIFMHNERIWFWHHELPKNVDNPLEEVVDRVTKCVNKEF